MNFIRDYWRTIAFLCILIGASIYAIFIYNDGSDHEPLSQEETLQEIQTTYNNIVELSGRINDIVTSTPESTRASGETMVVTLLTGQETLDRCVDEARTYGYIIDDYIYKASSEEQHEMYALLAENDLPLSEDGVRAKCLLFTHSN